MASAVVSYKLTIAESQIILNALDRQASAEHEYANGISGASPDKIAARRREAEMRDLYRKLRENSV